MKTLAGFLLNYVTTLSHIYSLKKMCVQQGATLVTFAQKRYYNATNGR